MKVLLGLAALLLVLALAGVVVVWRQGETEEAALSSTEVPEAELRDDSVVDDVLVLEATPGADVAVTPTVKPLASTAPAAVASVVVSVDETGFNPAKLTVEAGTAVKFMNNGQAMHWPASDPHPAHNGLSGFDAESGLATGDEYSYTFTKSGTWTYHDHLNPTLTGSVVVE